MKPRKNLRSFLVASTTLLVYSSACAQTTYIGSNTTNADRWNLTSSWDNATVPSGAVDVIIPTGKIATAWSNATPTYTGTLTMAPSSTIQVGWTTDLTNSWNCLGTAGSTVITMGNGALIKGRTSGSPSVPAIALEGNVTFSCGESTQTPASPTFGQPITGPYTFTLQSNAANTTTFSAPNTFSELIVKAITGRGGSHGTVVAAAPGSLGADDVTIDHDGSASQLAMQLWMNSSYAMSRLGTLNINGNGPAGDGLNKLRMGANVTIAGLNLNGAAQPAGTYGKPGSGATFTPAWISTSSTGILTVDPPSVAYWDSDGATAGAGGATPTGTWGTDTFWSPSAAGDAATAAWNTGDIAVFSAGTDATGTYSVSVDGTQSIGSLIVQDGSVTLANGTAGELRLTADSNFDIATGTTTIQTPVIDDGSARTLTKTGGGTLHISGNSSHTGLTTVDGGILQLSGDNSAAVGGTTVTSGLAQFDSLLSINGVADDNLTVQTNGIVRFGASLTAGDITNALGRVAPASAGVIAADNHSTKDFDFNTAGLTGAYFGAIGSVNYTGTLTPNGTTYRLGGAGGILTLPGALTSGHVLALRAGTVQLNGFSSTIGGLSNSGSTILENGSATTDITLTVNHTGTNTYGGILQDGGAAELALTKEGSGTLILNGVNSYTGDTTISEGTLRIGTNGSANGAVLGGGNYAGNISIASGATLSVSTNANQTLSGVISGAGNLQKVYSGTVVLAGNNTYTGKTFITPTNVGGGNGAGTVSVSSFNSVVGGSASSSLGAPTTVENGTIEFGTTAVQFGATILYTGTGETTDRVINFLMNGNGAGKTLDASGSGPLRFTSTFTKSGSNSNDITLTGTGEGVIDGGLPFAMRNFVKSGSGTWTLSAASGWTGTATISGGCLVLNHADVIPGGIGATGGTRVLIFNGGVVGLAVGDFTRPLNTNATVTAANFTGNGGWAAYNADRIVNLGGASASITWATANTGFNAKTLILGAATATHKVTLQNPIDLGNAARTVQVDDGAAAIDGELSGDLSGTGGSLNKNGTGTLALSGTISYTGATTINAGVLDAVGDASIPSSSLIQIRGGVLQGSGTITRNVNTAAGGLNWSTSSGGFAARGGTLTLQLNGGTGSLTWNGSSFVSTGQTLIFGSTSANSLVDFQNSINLGSSGTNTRTISVIDNPGSSTDIARISGDLTNTAAGQGLLKTGDGTLELAGTNSYTGATTVSEGTLALVGGSQESAITVDDGASLGFTLGSPTTSTASVDLTDGTVKITGTVDNSSDYQLMTASSFIGGTPSLASGITDYVLELQNSDTELWLVYTGSGGSPFETWADGTFAGGTLTDKTPGGDDEGDGLTNLREFAFGTDPTVSFTGSMEYVAGGDVTTPGQPVLLEEGGTYYAVFGRRKDHVAAGLTYTVEFSADLTSPWVASAAVPTLVTGDPSAGDIEAVRVPFPGLIPTDSGPQKATFFRVEVELAP